MKHRRTWGYLIFGFLVACSLIAGTVAGVGTRRSVEQPQAAEKFAALPSGIPKQLVQRITTDTARYNALRLRQPRGQVRSASCPTLNSRKKSSYPTAPYDPQSAAAASAAFVPSDLKSLSDASQVIVDARVVGVSVVPPVPSLTIRAAPGSGTTQDLADRNELLSSQKVSLVTCEVHKGTIGATFTILRQGGGSVTIEGDRPYSVGDRYLLFLTRREPDYFRVVSPEGRLFIKANGSILSTDHGVGTILDGLPSTTAAMQAVRENLLALSPRAREVLAHEAAPTLTDIARIKSDGNPQRRAQEYFSSGH